jgi:serine protease Do
MNVTNIGSEPSARTGRGKRMWRMAGLGAGVAVGIAAVIALGQVRVNGQAADRQRFGLSQLLGGSGIGVTIRDVDNADVTREKLPASLGAVVDDVRAESPAAKAGIRAGDVIVSFDGEKIRSARHFARLVDETPEGREVETTVIRNGERLNVKVTPVVTDSLAFNQLLRPGKFATADRLELLKPGVERFSYSFPQLNSSDFFTNQGTYTFSFGNRTRLGVSGQNLSGQLGDYFGTPEGVLVTSVDDGTPARTAGLKAGDVITRINGETVRNLTDLRRLMGSASGETKVTIFRDRKEQTISLKIEDERVVTTRRRIVR